MANVDLKRVENLAEENKRLKIENGLLNEGYQQLENTLKKLQVNEEELAELKDRSIAILKSVADGLLAIDKQGMILIFNGVAEEMTGMLAKDVVGKHYGRILKIFKSGSKDLELDFISDVINENKIIKLAGDTVISSANGNEIPVINLASPVIDKNGVIIGCVVVIHDVSEERRVDKAKTEFVSLASHQLRTPLSAINWYTEMLLDEKTAPMSSKGQDCVKGISRASRRMVGLVNALLDASRLEMGTFALERMPVDVIEVAETCLDELRPLIEEKNQVLIRSFGKGLDKIETDPRLLEMIFQNYLSNSVKYTKVGGEIKLTVKKEKDLLLISVADNGIGIPENHKKGIFGKLFRADNARIVDPDGFGLGLYIVKEAAEKMGGKVWFESEERKGSTFFASLLLVPVIKK